MHYSTGPLTQFLQEFVFFSEEFSVFESGLEEGLLFVIERMGGLRKGVGGRVLVGDAGVDEGLVAAEEGVGAKGKPDAGDVLAAL
jgi:hypothetical protein